MNKILKPNRFIRKVMLVISSCAFFLLVYRVNIEYVLTSFLLTILFSVLGIENMNILEEKKVYVIISAIISIIISLLLFRNYMSIYSETSIWIIEEISSITGISYISLIRIIGIIASLASLYLLFLLINRTISVFVYYVKNSDLETVFKDVINKDTRKALTESLKILILCIIAGFALLLIVFAIPVESVSDSIRTSASFLSEEGMYPKKYDWCTSRLDNSTDSIMLLEIVYNGAESLIKRAVNVYRESYEGDASYRTLVNIYVKGGVADCIVPYARYWHGYLITLKPLMCFISYKEIRKLNLIIQLLLDAVLVVLLYKKEKKEYIIPYVLSVLMIMPLIISDSLQYSTCFYLMSIASILTLTADEKNLKYWQVFFLAGIGLAYFDFLTYPVAVLGVPLVFYLIKNDETENEKKLAMVLRLILFWLLGYTLMWFSKWVLASILTENNIIIDGIKSVVFRTSGEIEEESVVTAFSVVIKNISRFFYTPFSFALMLYVIIIRSRTDKSISFHNRAMNLMPFVMVGLLPIVWFTILRNHSMIHSYFTNKALIVSVFALTSAFTTINKIRE